MLGYIHLRQFVDIKSFMVRKDRTAKATKNIIASFGIKGIDSIVYLLIVPITLDYLNPYEYGVWLTLNSILVWINSFDIGLGNGLRNNLAVEIANERPEKARIYVSTTFFMLVAIMIIIFLLGVVAFRYINWFEILNVTHYQIPRLNQVVFVSFAIFCMTFVFKFIGNVFLGLQMPAINNLLVSSGHLLSLIIIFLLTKFTNGTLLNVAVAYTGSSLLVYLLAYPIVFYGKYYWLRPSYKLFNIQYLHSLFGLGINFFIIQIGGVVLFSLSNLVISHMFGPQEVTPYNVAYRYFSIILMFFGIIVSPIWSATTDAFQRHDIDWIKSVSEKLFKLVLIIIVLLTIMVVISQFVFKLWIGSEVNVPVSLCIFLACYVVTIVWSVGYSNILNGLGKIRIQTYNIIAVSLLYYPICKLLGGAMGVQGVVLGMIILNIPGLILNIIQFNIIISGRAKGIWNK